MPAGTPIALTTVRVRRSEARPSDDFFRRALESDRRLLGLAPAGTQLEISVAGPYPVHIGGDDFDEYVTWEN